MANIKIIPICIQFDENKWEKDPTSKDGNPGYNLKLFRVLSLE
jgi:hypothetical protein